MQKISNLLQSKKVTPKAY